jgi:hypothetical protein
MKSKGLVFIFILSLIPQFGLTQTVSKFGLELGVSFSQFTSKDNWSSIYDLETTRVRPLMSPLIGISREWRISEHFQFNSGLQYHMTGTRTYILDKDISGAFVEYTETWENLKMHKICLPLTIGYVFRLGKLKPTFYIGVTPNYIFSLSLEFHDHSHYRINNQYGGAEDTYTESGSFSLNPHRKLMNQFTTGFSTPIGQHIKINLNYNAGHNYYSVTSTIHGMHSSHTITEKTSIPGSDYIITLQYKFNRPEKNNEKSKKEFQ